MPDNKWFLEVVRDQDGTYYANMILGGKRVEGLPVHVNYNTLREAIRQKTGVEILKKRHMKFQQSGYKKYAYLDNTQERKDCRVTLNEMNQGWKPDFNETTQSHLDPVKRSSLDTKIQSAAVRAKESLSAKTIENNRSVPSDIDKKSEPVR